MLATVLPIMLVSARHSDMNLSMPKMSMIPATGTVPSDDSVAASTMNPEPVTPAAPLDVSRRIAISPSCAPSDRVTSCACATYSAASVR